MIIGLLSDSHGQLERLRGAINQLAARGCRAIVHCGDIGGAECIPILASTPAIAHAVGGNTDRWRHAELAAAARLSGVVFSPHTVELDVGDGRWLVATHGDNHALLESLVVGGRFSYVCHGHTHIPRDERQGGTRILNPGALFQYRNDPPTVAVLDTSTEALELLTVE